MNKNFKSHDSCTYKTPTLVLLQCILKLDSYAAKGSMQTNQEDKVNQIQLTLLIGHYDPVAPLVLILRTSV